MKKVLIIAGCTAGCQILQKMNDYHTVVHKAVNEGMDIKTIDQINARRDFNNTDRMLEEDYERMNGSFDKTLLSAPSIPPKHLSENKPKYIRQQHKLAQRHYRRK